MAVPSTKAQIVKGDLLRDINKFPSKMLAETHEVIKGGVENAHPKLSHSLKKAINSLLLRKGPIDGLMWLVPGIVSLTYTREKDGDIKVSILVLANEVTSTTLGHNKLGETLTFDAFIAKAKIYVGYNSEKTKIIYKGTACYRKIPSLSWRCVTTGEKTIYTVHPQ